jgi:hypothetical protein
MLWHRAYRSMIYAEERACDDRTAEVRLTETDMTILKLVLIGSLRIVFMGSLKVALFVYAIFLSDTPFAGAVANDNGYVGDNASYAAAEGDNGNMGQRGPLPAVTRSSSREETGLLGRSKG